MATFGTYQTVKRLGIETRSRKLNCGEQPMRSPNLYADPATVLDVYGYDARARADEAVKFLLERRVLVDDSIDVTRRLTRS